LTSIKSSLVFAFLFLALLVGYAFADVPPTELLYVQQGQNIITYSVNTTTAVTKKLGTLGTAYNGATNITINRSGSFLYLLGFSPAIEYFTVYSLTAAGVPHAKPIQTLVVKPALMKFFIHPNGKIAYAFFHWTQVVDGTTEYASDIVLFTINAKTGKLTNTTKPVASYPLNASDWPNTEGMNRKGTVLYTDVESLTINAESGALGQPAYPTADFDAAAIGDTALGFIFNLGPEEENNIEIDHNPTSGVSLYDFKCFYEDLPVCGDLNGPGIWMHPSSAYIFFYDRSLNEVPILYISTVKGELEESRAGLQSIPGSPSTIAFSPDGLLVYAQEGSEILVYVFNPHSGVLTAKSTIEAAGILSFLPRQ
jgi:hypothetical protein